MLDKVCSILAILVKANVGGHFVHFAALYFIIMNVVSGDNELMTLFYIK